MPYPAIIPEMFSHISENVPVNLLLFASEEDGKLSFSSGFVHAPLSAGQSIVISLPSYSTKVISSKSRGRPANFNPKTRQPLKHVVDYKCWLARNRATTKIIHY